MLSESFIAKAQFIKLAIFDIDGVMTDGRIFIDDKGLEIKAFHVLDGAGIKFLQSSNIDIAVISGRDAPSVTYRLKALGIQHIYQGHTDKLPIYQRLCQQLNVKDSEVLYVGDDLPDIPLLKRVGLPITVPNAVAEVKDLVPYVTAVKGGKGAVREICECLMRAQGSWDKLINKYLS